MRVLVVAAVTLITITLTRCVPRTDKMQNNVKDLTSTTPNSMEEQMDKISNDLRPVMAECNETFRIEMCELTLQIKDIRIYSLNSSFLVTSRSNELHTCPDIILEFCSKLLTSSNIIFLKNLCVRDTYSYVPF